MAHDRRRPAAVTNSGRDSTRRTSTMRAVEDFVHTPSFGVERRRHTRVRPRRVRRAASHARESHGIASEFTSGSADPRVSSPANGRAGASWHESRLVNSLGADVVARAASGGYTMGYQCSRPGVNVRVDGLMLTETHFVIQAAVEYDSSLSDAERERLAPRAQIELLLAIEGEEARARRLGAKSVRVGVVGDERLYRLFRAASQEPPPADAERPSVARPARRGTSRSLASVRPAPPADLGA